jgi:hypothetical protein
VILTAAIRYLIAALIVAVSILLYIGIASLLGIDVPSWAWFLYALVSLQMTYDRLEARR